MADQADERSKAMKRASVKEALGKLTGNDELEAQGAREKVRGGAGSRAPAAGTPPAAKKPAASRGPKKRSPR